MRSENRPSCGSRFSAMSSLRHDLDAGHHQRRHGPPGLQDFPEHAVHAKPDHEAVLEGLDVDVRGVVLHRRRQQGVDEPDDRRVVIALEQVGGFGQFLGDAEQVGVLTEAIHHLHGGVRFALVGLLQLPVEFRRRHDLHAHGAVDEAPDLGDRRQLRIRADDGQRAAIQQAVDQDAVALGKGEGQDVAPHFRRELGSSRRHALEPAVPQPGRRGAQGPPGFTGGSLRRLAQVDDRRFRGGEAWPVPRSRAVAAPVGGKVGRSVRGIRRGFLGLMPSCSIPDVVVLGIGLKRGLHVVPKDRRLDEDHQVGLLSWW